MFIYNFKINGGIALRLIIIILSLFMLFVFGISINRIFFTNGKIKINDEITASKITEINPENYTNILKAVHDDMASYENMKIKFVGYVYRLIDFETDEFVLARDMLINEDGSQSVVVGFLCESDEIKNYKDGDWIEIIGIIKKGKYHMEEIPIIKITEIYKVEEPEKTFVLPPSDTYIPTSGLL